MKHDPIVEEIHQIREKILDDYDGDLEKWMNRLKVAEKNDQRHIVNTETLQEKDNLFAEISDEKS
jgi:hypothetical protein